MNQDMYEDNMYEEISQEELDAWEAQFYQESTQEMAKTEKVVPEKDLKPVKDAAKDMTTQMKGYRQMEQDCGHSQPEVWKEHAKKQKTINQNLSDCRDAYEQEQPQAVKQTAIQKARDSFEDAGKAFKEQIQKLNQMYAKELEAQREANRWMQAQMAQMQETIKDLREASQTTLTPEQLMVAAEAFRVFQETVKQNQEHHLKEIRDTVSHTVQDTCHAISEAPRRVRNAIKAKAYHAVESVLSRTTARLNEASRQIEASRQRAESQEKQAIARSKATPAKWRLKDTEKADEKTAGKTEEKTVEKAQLKRRVTVRRPQENSKSRGMER